MATPISGATAFAFGEAAQTDTPQTQTPQVTSGKQPAQTEFARDSINLSDGTQVQLLRRQGQTVAEIAINTALSTQAVNSYLGISEAAPPPVAVINK